MMDSGPYFILALAVVALLFINKWLQRRFLTKDLISSNTRTKSKVRVIQKAEQPFVEPATYVNASINLSYVPFPPIKLLSGAPNNWYDIVSTFEIVEIPDQHYTQYCAHQYLPLHLSKPAVPVHMTRRWHTYTNFHVAFFDGACPVCEARLHTLLLARS